VAIRRGRCTNFGNCSVADKGQILQVPDGADFICPECSRPLTDMGRPAKPGSPVPIILGILLLCFVGAGYGI
jgi:phosphate transport system substrate-binding protein